MNEEVSVEEMRAMAKRRVRRAFGMTIAEYIAERRAERIDGCDGRAAGIDVFLGWMHYEDDKDPEWWAEA